MIAISGYLVMTKRTAKAVYAAMVFLGDFQGSGGDAQWLPLSQLHGLIVGDEFEGAHRGEKRAEFHATVPVWLAKKLFPSRTDPIPFAQRPW